MKTFTEWLEEVYNITPALVAEISTHQYAAYKDEYDSEKRRSELI